MGKKNSLLLNVIMEDDLTLAKSSYEKVEVPDELLGSIDYVINAFLEYPKFKRVPDSKTGISYGKDIRFDVSPWAGKKDGSHIYISIKFKGKNKLLKIKKIEKVALKWGSKYKINHAGAYRIGDTFTLLLFVWYRIDWSPIAEHFDELFKVIKPYFKTMF